MTGAEKGATRGGTAAEGATALGNDRRFATTLARGLSVLRAFRADDDGLGNAELAARTGLPRSTVSRLTFTLRALGYLEHTRDDERYRPGPVLLALGNVAAGAIPFVDAAAVPMQRLADRTGTLAVLGVRDAEKLLLVRTWRPRGVASLWLEVGHRVPIRRSSSGHALLGALTGAAFERVLETLVASERVGRNNGRDGKRNDGRDDDGRRCASVGVGHGGGDDARAGSAEERDHFAGDIRRMRREARRQLRARGFVIAGPRDYFTPNIHAAAVPFHANELAEPVVFTCGATPEALSLERLRGEVGPALRTVVDALATAGARSAARGRTEPERREVS